MGTFQPPKADKDTRRKSGLRKKFGTSNVSKGIVCMFHHPLIDALLFGGALFDEERRCLRVGDCGEEMEAGKAFGEDVAK